MWGRHSKTTQRMGVFPSVGSWEAYYACVWCYDGTSTPAAIVYEVSPHHEVIIQTMPFPVKQEWRALLTCVALVLFCWVLPFAFKR